MSTTAFQKIFDLAQSISINRRAVTAQTISRDNTVRSVSRGGQVWRFEVKLPDGIAWTDLRGIIEAIDHADRFTTGAVQINHSGYNNWLMPYQGDCLTTDGFTVTATQGSNELTMTATPSTLSSGNYFKSGDLIQLQGGRVYSVIEDVGPTATTIKVNRPVLDASNSYALVVGPNVTWNVICVEMPQWTIFSRNQVSWNGTFTFYEAML